MIYNKIFNRQPIRNIVEEFKRNRELKGREDIFLITFLFSGVKYVSRHDPFKIIFSVACRGDIGLERAIHGGEAGFRTHTLACVSSSLLMSLLKKDELFED